MPGLRRTSSVPASEAFVASHNLKLHLFEGARADPRLRMFHESRSIHNEILTRNVFIFDEVSRRLNFVSSVTLLSAFEPQ